MRARRQRKKESGIGLIVFAVAMVIFMLAAAGYFLAKVYRSTQTETQSGEESTTSSPELEARAKAEVEEVNSLLSAMSLSDKLYQMMFVTPESITGVKTVIRAGEATQKALESQPVGGIVYFAYNLQDREQTIEMISNTQKMSTIPLFIGVDEEGGSVARLGSNPKMGVTEQPTMKSIGEGGDPEQAYEVGEALAADLRELGFNVDFAPVADVIIDPNNTEIGDRSFGTAPELVADMVANTVKGLEDNDVSSAIKHFPGHGSTTKNSHDGYSESTRTAEELRKNEFIPFKAGIDAGVDFVMVSHMTPVNAAKEKVPSSVSKEVITDMLKNELGFKGIVITDSFSMGAITENFSVEEAVTKAVSAGADMILMPSDVNATHAALLKAVEEGKLTEERINESVRKILELKIKKGMIQ